MADKKELPAYISESKPEVKSDSLKISVHSPVSLDAYDGIGNHTGYAAIASSTTDLVFNEEGMPNSSYEETGEGKYLIVPGNQSQIKIHGLDVGTFSLIVGDYENDKELSRQSFLSIPVVPALKGTLDFSATSSYPILSLDVDGDGKEDAALSPGNERNPISYMNILRKIISTLELRKDVQKNLEQRLDKIIALQAKGKQKNILMTLDAFNKKLDMLSTRLSKKESSIKKIDSAVALVISNLLNELFQKLEN
jgi:hypothetical protein